jgi:hypothetical protein
MKWSLRIALVICISLASCAKHPITKVSVKVGDTFSGYFRLTTCIPGAQEPVVLNGTVEGYTSACPSGDVEITVIKPSKTVRIAPENVHVRRSGDGTPVAMSAQIP